MIFTYQLQNNPKYATIQFNGNLVAPDQPADLIKDIDGLITNGVSNLIIDLSGLNQMNSTGLNLLINLLTKTRNAGGDTIIASIPERIQKLIVITKLNTVFSVAKNVEEAVGMINKEEQWL